MFRVLMLAAMALCSVPAHAATWYVFNNIYSDTSIYFFDFDTVAKQGDKVTIWVKYIKKPNHPDSDGSYATASKMVYSCSKRKSQDMSSSIYDSDGDFMKTYPNPGKEVDIIPDTLGESLLKTVCASDFPRDESEKIYFAVKDNDIRGLSKTVFGFMEAAKNDPAPK